MLKYNLAVVFAMFCNSISAHAWCYQIGGDYKSANSSEKAMISSKRNYSIDTFTIYVGSLIKGEKFIADREWHLVGDDSYLADCREDENATLTIKTRHDGDYRSEGILTIKQLDEMNLTVSFNGKGEYQGKPFTNSYGPVNYLREKKTDFGVGSGSNAATEAIKNCKEGLEKLANQCNGRYVAGSCQVTDLYEVKGIPYAMAFGSYICFN